MTRSPFKATAYIKDGCPFSFKFLTFMAEAGLLGTIGIVRVREGDSTAEAAKQKLVEKLGKASFPAVEIEPDRFMADSDKLIEHYAGLNDVRADALPVLSLYKETIFPKLIEHHKLTSGKQA